MTTLKLIAFALSCAVVVGALTRRIFRLRADHYRNFGPHLYYRIVDLLEPFDAKRLSDDQLMRLERQAQALFEDILTGVGLVPTGWRIKLVLDDVRGPIPMVVSQAGESLSLAEFEGNLRNGKVTLPRP